MNSSEVRAETEPAESAGLLIRRVAAVFEQVPQRDRLRAVLALGPALARVENAVVLVDDAIVAAFPGTANGRAAERLRRRARAVFETEQFAPPHYVARIGTRGQGRVAMRWEEPVDASLPRAQAFATLCGWALDAADLARLPSTIADRTATLRRIEQLVRGALRGRRRFAVLHVDVEESRVSAERGETLAHGLRRVVRATDHVGTLGTNTFAVLVSLDTHEIEAFVAAQRILAAAGERSCAHVGVAVFPDDGAAVDDLLEKASAAALAATSAGSELPYWFREETGRRLRRQARTDALLRDAAETQALTLRCRPAFDPYTGAVSAVFAEAAAPDEQLHASAPLGRHVRGAVDRWTIRAAAAVPLPIPVPRIYVHVDEVTPELLETVLAGMQQGTHRLGLALRCGEIDASCAGTLRRLRARGVAIGMDALQAGAFIQRGTVGLDLDFVTVDAGTSTGTLAALACGAILAPRIVVVGVTARDEGRWLARHGATALAGPGLAPDVDAAHLADALTRTVAL